MTDSIARAEGQGFSLPTGCEIAQADFVAMFERVIKPHDPVFTYEDWGNMARYYHVKYRVSVRVRPARILEIGVRAGYSAWAFLCAGCVAEYYGIDAYNGTHSGGRLGDGLKEWAEGIIAAAGCPAFRIQVEDSYRLHSLPAADLYHVDGDHSHAGAAHDIALCYASAPAGSVILVDDYDFIGEVRQAFDEFRGTLGPGDGVATVPSYRGEGLIFKARPFPSWVVDLGGRGL